MKDNYINFLRLIACPGGPLSSKTKAFKNEKKKELSSKSFQFVDVQRMTIAGRCLVTMKYIHVK